MPDLLAAAVRATAASSGPDDLLDRVARLLVPFADWVLADLLHDPDLVTRVAASDANGPLVPADGRGAGRARRSSAHAGGLLPALDAAPGRLLRLDREQLLALAQDPEPVQARQAALAVSLGAHDLLLVGLQARGSPAGVLSLGSRTALADDVVAQLGDLALHVGLALDAARMLVVQREVATALQRSLLPPVPLFDGVALAARYAPAAQGLEVGGDWYDAFATGTDPAELTVVIGDASGHDVAAAVRMADLRNLLRAHAVDRPEPPSALLQRLERTTDLLGLDATATCVVGALRRAAGERAGWELQWSSAGHLPPLLLTSQCTRLLETTADLMLGVERGTARQDHVQPLAPGDVVVLYTDGLVEQRGVPLEERLELLRASADGHRGDSPDHLAELLLRTLADGATDDVALLVMQVD